MRCSSFEDNTRDDVNKAGPVVSRVRWRCAMEFDGEEVLLTVLVEGKHVQVVVLVAP